MDRVREIYKVVENLLANERNHVKGCTRRDRVHEHVAMDADKVLGVQDRILILVLLASSFACHPAARRGGSFLKRTSTHLACRIHDLRRELFSLEMNLFGKGVFNGRVVTFNKVSLDELDRERGFPYCSHFGQMIWKLWKGDCRGCIYPLIGSRQLLSFAVLPVLAPFWCVKLCLHMFEDVKRECESKLRDFTLCLKLLGARKRSSSST